MAKIKKIVFSAFMIFSVGYIFRFIYIFYTSFQAYEIATAAGSVVEYFGIPFIAISIIGAVFGVFNISGRIIFGAYLISKNDRLLKPFWIIYFVGFAYTLIVNIDGLISGSMLFADASKLSDSRFRMIFPYMREILILAADLIIILYGIKKDKETH